MNNLISVICTVKNGEKTISKTIDSIVNQSYRNWELVIVDDGSSDGTVHILQKYCNEDSRIKMHLSGGIGRGKALNKAIELTNGEYVANIDADDIMHHRKLEIQLKIMLELSAFLICTKSELFYGSDSPKFESKISDDFRIKKINNMLLVRNQISHPSVLINKTELVSLGCYNDKRRSQLDYELWLRAFVEKKNMFLIDQNLVAKRIHQNQSFENKKRLRYTYNSFLLQTKYILKSRKHIYLLPMPLCAFFLSFLPFKFRRTIIKFLRDV